MRDLRYNSRDFPEPMKVILCKQASSNDGVSDLAFDTSFITWGDLTSNWNNKASGMNTTMSSDEIKIRLLKTPSKDFKLIPNFTFIIFKNETYMVSKIDNYNVSSRYYYCYTKKTTRELPKEV